MTAKLLLRIAALLMLLHTVGHTIGALGWKDNPDQKIVSIIHDMQSNHFVFMGSESSLAQFYQGYGFIMIIVLALIALCLWLFSTQAHPFARLLTGIFGVFLLFMAAMELMYFFPLAAGMTFFASVLTLGALYAKSGITV